MPPAAGRARDPAGGRVEGAGPPPGRDSQRHPPVGGHRAQEDVGRGLALEVEEAHVRPVVGGDDVDQQAVAIQIVVVGMYTARRPGGRESPGSAPWRLPSVVRSKGRRRPESGRRRGAGGPGGATVARRPGAVKRPEASQVVFTGPIPPTVRSVHGTGGLCVHDPNHLSGATRGLRGRHHRRPAVGGAGRAPPPAGRHRRPRALHGHPVPGRRRRPPAGHRRRDREPARRGGGHHRHRRAGVAGDSRGVGHGTRLDGRPRPGPHPGPGAEGGGRGHRRRVAGVGPVGDRADGRRAGQAGGRRGRRPAGRPAGVRDGEPRVHRRPGGGGGDGGAGAGVPVALPGRHPARPHPGRRRPQRPGRRHHLHQRPCGAQPVHDRGRPAGSTATSGGPSTTASPPPAWARCAPRRPATRASTSPSSPRSAGWACWCGR